MKMRLARSALALLFLFLPTLAQSQTLPGDPREGQKLAREVCVTCHKVEQGERGVVPPGVPAFQDIADDPAATETALQVFFRTPHADMPDLMLTPRETDDVIAYILGLR